MAKLIVIEGCDCSGKETQSKMLADRLNKEGKKCQILSFPMYDSPTGKIIGACYLGKEKMCKDLLNSKNGFFEEGASNVDPICSSLFYAADRRYNLPVIEKAISENDVVILKTNGKEIKMPSFIGLSLKETKKLCSMLGSDLNVCLEGGTLLATSRGEIIEKINCNVNYPVTLIKPKKLGISAKEAYTKYAAKEIKPQNNMTEKMINAINHQQDIKEFLYNDLEYAIFDDYAELQEIKSKLPNSIMSGSGSTYFVLENINSHAFSEDFQVISDLHFVSQGVCSKQMEKLAY